MIVLGIDTATSATAVALRLDDGSALEARDDPPAEAHPGHATRLLSMAGELLAQSGLGWSEVERLAVGVGPGAFTGLRVGVSTGRGLAQSLGVELAAISSTMALAAPALRAGEESVLACVDARRGEVFAAVYADGPLELRAPVAIAPERVADELAGDGAPLVVGDGALRYRERLLLTGLRLAEESSPLHVLRATSICELACLGCRQGDYQHVLPDYCRRPDAEITLEAASEGAS